MNLPVIEPMTYISPSTFLAWKNCPYSVYLEKLSGLLKTPRIYGRPARIGSLFDILASCQLIRERGMNVPNHNPTLNMRKLKPQDDELEIAQHICDKYFEQGCAYRLLNATKLSLQQTLYKIVDGVPLFGRLDANVDGAVFDWKTRGWGKNTTSPTAGYNKRVHEKHGVQKEHPDHTNLPVRKPDWATQMIFYNWLLGNEPVKYTIHEIVNTTKGIVFVEHKAVISSTYCESVWVQVQAMWNQINELEIDIPEPNPNSFKCEKYDTMCNSAVHCTKYKETLGGEEREFYS